MKLFAIHDAKGVIDHVVTVPKNAPPGAVVSGPGQTATEVDAATLHLDPAKPETLEKLTETIKRHRVEGIGRGKLVRVP